MEKGVAAEVLDIQNLRLGLCRIGIGLSSRYLLGTLMRRYLTMSKKGEDCLGKWKRTPDNLSGVNFLYISKE